MTYAIVENTLNPYRYHLSAEAKKRLRWMYAIAQEHEGNLTRAGDALNVSREWLTKLHRRFVRGNRDPRFLEPHSRAPVDRSKRARISTEAVNQIVAIRKKYPAWGKEKIARILDRDHGIVVSATTVGRYLKKKQLVSPKLSRKNQRAWETRRAREGAGGAPLRARAPAWLANAAPGSLIQKDMKLIAKPWTTRVPGKERLKQYFWYQHTMIDAVTRIRTLSLVSSADSRTAALAYTEDKTRFPFPIAALQTDNGGENEKSFAQALEKDRVIQFWSRPGTPTDNPRVERSHRSDDDEFYKQGNLCRTFEEQSARLRAWENIGNDVRPHQALGYLTPNAYCALWKTDRKKAVAIQQQWNAYLGKQSKRLRTARREIRQEKLRALNDHLSATLGGLFTPVKV